jgi:dolichol-phosphate mannosyltransferase
MIRIILPAYNEQAAVAKLIEGIDTVLRPAVLSYQIIVVNDGSSDKTLEIAHEYARSYPVEVIDHGRNRGLGEALRSGLTHAAKLCTSDDVVITMDADNTHPPDLIPSMVGRIYQGYDVVIASRFVTGAKEYGLRLHRKALSRGASILMRMLFPTSNIRDYTCGYRAYRAGVIQDAIAEYGDAFIVEKGFNAIVEILLKLRSRNLKACEVPLLLHYDRKEGASKMPIIKTVMRYWTLIAHQLFISAKKKSAV